MTDPIKKTEQKPTTDIPEEHQQITKQTSPKFADNRPEALAQRKRQAKADQSPQAIKTTQLQAKADANPPALTIPQTVNNTGLPTQLKSNIENLSGHSMDDVKVHYNSSEPAQLNAHAYAQGSNIHLGPGHEKHLAHEAWHVVQQKQGRVKSTKQLKGKVQINDDQGLEQEADQMAVQLLQMNTATQKPLQRKATSGTTVQLKTKNLPDPFVIAAPLPEDLRGNITKAKRFLTSYNGLGVDNTHYAAQKGNLTFLKDEGLPALTEVIGLLGRKVETQRRESLALETQLRQIDERIGLKADEKREKEVLHRQQAEKVQSLAESASSAGTGEVEESPHDIATRRLRETTNEIETLQEDIDRLTREKIPFAETLRIKEAAIQHDQAQIVTITDGRVDLAADIDTEIADAVQKMDTHSNNAKLPSIPVISGLFTDRTPKAINNLITKFNALSNSDKYHEKLSIIVNIDKKVASWKNEHMDQDQLKQPNDQSQKNKLQVIKLIQEQLFHTRKRVFSKMFDTEGAAPKREVPAVLPSAGILKDTFGAAATLTRGSRFTGGAGSSVGIAGGLSRTTASTGIEALSLAGAGSNFIGQIFRAVEVGNTWADVKSKKDVIKALMATLGLLTTGAAEATIVATEALRLKDKESLSVKPSTFSEATDSGKAEMLSKGVAQGVFAVQHAASALKSVYKIIKNAGVDNDKVLTHSLEGGISFGKALVATLKVVKEFTSSFSTVQSITGQAIPIVALIINFMEAAEAGVRIYQSHRNEGLVDKELEELERDPLLSPLLADGEITRTEKRGVIYKNKYTRFHPFLMSKIDAHLAKGEEEEEEDGDLSVTKKDAVPQDGQIQGRDPETLELNKARIKKIREYEYLSKMKEINRKRKVKGSIDIVKAILNFTGDILSLTVAGAIPGYVVKGTTAAASLTHAGARAIDQRVNDKIRKKIDGKDFTSVSHYDAEVGRGEVDKSSKQKRLEYFRHARYIMDQYFDFSTGINAEDDSRKIEADFNHLKVITRTTGVSMAEFLKAETPEEHIKLLMDAMKSGR